MSFVGSAIKTRRGTEAVLLAFAVLLATAAYAAVGMAIQNELPPGLFTYGLAFGLLVALAHLAVRRFATYADPIILPAVAALNGLGLVLIYRLDVYKSDANRRLAQIRPG